LHQVHTDMVPRPRRFSHEQLAILNRVCFTICIVCIIGGTVLSLSMIWYAHDSEFLTKSWGTMGVLFVGSALTLVVSRIVGGRGEPPPQRSA